MNTKFATTICAERALKEALVGAQLVKIVAMSMVVELIFETDRLSKNFIREINLSFSTRATVTSLSPILRPESCAGFHKERSILMSEVYQILGARIDGIRLSGDGFMNIDFGSKSINLYLDDENFLSDDSVWVVTIEISNSEDAEDDNMSEQIVCAPDGGQVHFYGSADSSGDRGRV